tara:strand:- start:476 stop:1522 length:1047 start_codon:yes stop_codon:yes gene_type:complete
MIKISELLIKSNASALEAIKVIENGSSKIALVVNSDEKLIGVLTDGDIRRSLLTGESLDSRIEKIMNKNFYSIREDEDKENAKEIMKLQKILQVPVLDKNSKVVDLLLHSQLENEEPIFKNSVVIMAGGIGSRLKPYTENCPKPMLKVGDKPILEILINQFISQGFSNFYISVKHLKEKIIDYFEDGSKFKANIRYLIEEKPLGTAGSLTLLPKTIKKPFIVVNGDVLTRFNSSQLINFHNMHNAAATICVRTHESTLPFGVVETNGIELKRFYEKPTYRNLVNAGVYAIDPIILPLLQRNKRIDMPEFLVSAKEHGNKIIACPIHEYWIDIGRPETLKEAHTSWNKS